MKKIKKRFTSFGSILMMVSFILMCIGIGFGVHAYMIGNGQVPVYAGQGYWSPAITSSNRIATTEFVNIQEDRAGYFTVPLPEGTDKTKVVISNISDSHMVLIRVPGADMDFYHRNPFSGDMNNVTGVKYGFDDDGAVVELDSDGVYEIDSNIEDDRLYIKLVPPQEIYDKILVINAAYGGDETGSVGYGLKEKDITLAVSEAIRNHVSGNDIGVYFTRTADVNVSSADRIKMINDVDADMVITLRVAGDEDTRITRGMNVLFYSVAEADAAQFMLDAISAKAKVIPNMTAYQAKGELQDSSDARFFGIDLAYITNKGDVSAYLDKTRVDRVGEAIAEAAEMLLKD
ncbi:MAG: N-acetylmuramoyl-L-alanine amidase [Lachnospiraceae bacterium]|nr:N-acetylmuramoyl-L-alanine amidase [Lachnospiraceae bacterium]